MVSSDHDPPAGKRTALVIVRTSASEQRAQASLQRQVNSAQASWERSGFRFLKDPLFLASSVFVKKPERIIALPLDYGLMLAGLSFSRIPVANPAG